MNYKIEFLGCKVNSYEADCLNDELEKRGYSLFDEKKDSSIDIVIINTCAVTETSVTKDRKMIRHYKKKYPSCILVAMGCYAQYMGKTTQDELGIDIVVGTSNRSQIPSLIDEYLINKKKIYLIEENRNIDKYEEISLKDTLGNTRAYVKIQDGCDNFCTYCLIPYIRGRSRSRSKETILDEIRSLLENNYKEIVLTGIDMGSYGVDKDDHYFFSDLIEDILKTFPNLYRLRISSLEESQIDDKLLDLFKNYKTLASHFHIPLQSGSEFILKKMNRKYNLENYKKTIKKIRSIREDVAITTDVIVGFPYESEDLFLETYKFIKEIKFSKVHVFPYSRRQGTIANKYPEQVEEVNKKLRVASLIELSNDLEEEYKSKFYGKTIEFLFENYDPKMKAYRGHSSNYLEYYYQSDKNITNEVLTLEYKDDKKLNIFDNVKKIFSRL